MKYFHLPLIVFTSFLCVMFTACGGGESSSSVSGDGSDNAVTTAEPVANSNAGNATATTPNTIAISENGQENITLDFNDQETVIKYQKGNKILSGHFKRADKSKYFDNNGDVLVAEIKYKEDGFKLKDNDGQLLWKIKYKDTKIKISDNEENENPFEIKKK